jgi:thiol-disulfide isomerase/thioredoxin
MALGAAGTVAASADVDRFQAWRGPTPELALSDPAGTPHRLEAYRGRVVLLNFWATWCEPCREEMPTLARLQAQLAGEPFAVLAVNHGESPAAVARFLRELPVGFAVLLDRDREASRAWRVRVLPTSVLLDRHGRARHRIVGEIDWTAPAALAAVRRLLVEPAP